MNRQRVIRSGARRSGTGARSLVWLGAAAALPVVVTTLVLVAGTLAVLVFADAGFDRLPALVATEWLVLHRAPLVADGVEIGMLPLLAPLIMIIALALQTRSALVNSESDDARAAVTAVGAVSAASLLATGVAMLVLDSAPSDYAVREAGVASALGWTLAVALVGAGAGVWLRHRRDIRERLPYWVTGGLRLGVGFTMATWFMGALVVTILLVAAWGPVGDSLAVADGFVGLAGLTLLSIAYLPNLVLAAATVALGGEAYLGGGGFSVFAVAPGPIPDMPLGYALPVGEPHWTVQLIVVMTAAFAVVIARIAAPRFESVADGIRATCLGAVLVALATGAVSAVAGGNLGVLGTAGTGELIGMGLALLVFGVIGSITTGLTLSTIVRRRQRQRVRLEARRRASGRERAHEEVPPAREEPDEVPESDELD